MGVIIASLSPGLYGQTVDMRSKLKVKGEARLFKPADQLSISIGVVSQAETAEQAAKDNTEKMNKVMEALRTSGLTSEEIETGNYSIDPVWSTPPKEYDSSWVASVVGYRVTNTLSIRSGKLDKAGDFIDKATKAGANSVGNVQFGMKDAKAFRSEAITAASQNAIEDARILANSTKQKLVRLLDVELDEPRFSGRSERATNFMMAKSADLGGEVPINPGQVEITSSVSLIYEIAP